MIRKCLITKVFAAQGVTKDANEFNLLILDLRMALDVVLMERQECAEKMLCLFVWL